MARDDWTAALLGGGVALGAVISTLSVWAMRGAAGFGAALVALCWWCAHGREHRLKKSWHRAGLGLPIWGLRKQWIGCLADRHPVERLGKTRRRRLSRSGFERFGVNIPYGDPLLP